MTKDPALAPLDLAGHYAWTLILEAGCQHDGRILRTIDELTDKKINAVQMHRALRIMHSQQIIEVKEWKLDRTKHITNIVKAAMGDYAYEKLNDTEKQIVAAHGGIKIIKMETEKNILQCKKELDATIRMLDLIGTENKQGG